ncbi:S8 family serine peptidase [bacterium]|nr:S8 family serine peptidase [bacterium]
MGTKSGIFRHCKVISVILIMAISAVFSQETILQKGNLRSITLNDPNMVKMQVRKLDYVLSRIARANNIDLDSIGLKNRKFVINDSLDILICPPVDMSTDIINIEDFIRLGCRVKYTSKRFVRLICPLDKLQDITSVSNIGSIGFPSRADEQIITSQGVSKTGASDFHLDGYTGSGVDIAVIDLGFIGFTAAVSAGELPAAAVTTDYTGSGFEDRSRHGTGVAEIVHDMAPDAKLFLYKVDTVDELEQAVTDCINRDIDIINYSVSNWVSFDNRGFFDGTGQVCNIVDNASNNNILWVNAAGNYGQRHCEGTFTDTNNNTWHEFTANNELLEINVSQFDPDADGDGQPEVDITFCWNSTWPTIIDYDLYLFDNNMNEVTKSADKYNPVENIDVELNPGTYYLALKRVSTLVPSREFEIYAKSSQTLEHNIPNSSLVIPADANSSISVAAIGYYSWENGPQQSYSSQGPTNDGRSQPIISGPDDVQNYSYSSGFSGTSAAAPHIAGALGLLKSKYPNETASQIRTRLINSAENSGLVSYSPYVYGHGRVNLSTPDTPPQLYSPSLSPPAGDTDTEFTFSIDYQDINNDAPDVFQVCIIETNTNWSMTTQDLDFTDGSTFTNDDVLTFSEGTYTYYYEARQGDITLRLPESPNVFSFNVTSSSSLISLDLQPSSIPEDGSTTTTATATVTNQSGSPVQGETVSFSSNGFPGIFSSTQAVTGSNGTASVTFRPSSSGTAVLSATTSGGLSDNATLQVTGGEGWTMAMLFEHLRNDGIYSVYHVTVKLQYPDGGWVQMANVDLSSTGGYFSLSDAPSHTSSSSITIYTNNNGTAGWAEADLWIQNSNTYIVSGVSEGVSRSTSVYLSVGESQSQTFTSYKTLSFQNTVNDVDWSANGNRVAAISGDGAVRLWNTSNWSTITTVTGISYYGYSLDFDNTSSYLIAGYGNGDLARITSDGGVTWAYDMPGASRFYDVDISPDGGSFVSGNSDEYCRIHSSSNGYQSYQFPQFTQYCMGVDWSPNGTYVALSDRDGNVKVHYASSHSLVSQNDFGLDDGTSVTSLDWSYNSQKIAIGVTNDRDIHIANPTNLNAGAEVSYTQHTGNVNDVKWSPDASMVASAGDDGVHIWDPSNGQLITKASFSMCEALTWNPEGTMLAVASGGNVLLCAPFDNLPPTVTITSHTDGQQVSTDVITIGGYASDNIGLSNLTVQVNSQSPIAISVDAQDYYEQSVNLNQSSNTIVVTATDGNNHQATANVTIEKLSDTQGPLISNPQCSPSPCQIGNGLLITAEIIDVFGGNNTLDANSVRTDIHKSGQAVISSIPLYDDGAHGDGGANDNVFGNTLDTQGIPEGTWFFDFYAEDVNSNSTHLADGTSGILFDNPTIANIAHTPEIPTNLESVRVEAELTDQSGISTATLFYSKDGGNTWLPGSMTHDSDNIWCDTIPAQSVSIVKYKVEALDVPGNKTVSGEYTYNITTSNTAPVVNSVLPISGQYKSPLLLSATSNDADQGDEVTAERYQYSVDGSSGWIDIGTDNTPEDGYIWSNTINNGSVWVRASAYDGQIWGDWFSGQSSFMIDNQPPEFTNWLQSPADINSQTTGNVTISLGITDNLSGLAPSNPQIAYKIGADNYGQYNGMSSGGDNTWQYVLAEPTEGWSSRSSEILYYRIYCEDNTGNAKVEERTDTIEVTGIESITLVAPNGGENYLVGSVQEIQWTSNGTSGNCTIEYSNDNGLGWAVLELSTPDDGSYNWTIPNTPSDQCLVRVTDTDGSPSGQSSAVFTIESSGSQIMPFTTGWNMFSLNVTPDGDQDLQVILDPILAQLDKVIDEQGNTIYQLFGSWTNTIGDWTPTEGYYIKVNANADLEVSGTDIALPIGIPLTAGWNITSYPAQNSQDALAAVQPLIDSGQLVKVIDESGNTIINLFGTWQNSIGSFTPGEGYYVKVNGGCALTISEGSGSLAADLADNHMMPKEQPEHYQAYSSNPYRPMSVFVTSCRFNEKEAEPGDEIAVFDGDRCVGVAVVISEISRCKPLEIRAASDDGSGTGFISSNSMTFKLWKQNRGKEFTASPEGVHFLDHVTGQVKPPTNFEALGTAVVEMHISEEDTQDMQPEIIHLSQNYPNPFNPETNISYTLTESAHVTLKIFNASGQIIKILKNGFEEQGTYTVQWFGRNERGDKVQSGIYFYSLKTDTFKEVKKMMFIQ